jgi:flavin-dependent dehydrogenase
MESFDAVIVGGGPAGSTCAWTLRRAGLKVCLVDRAVFPRDKVCAGWITPPVIDALELDARELDDYRQARVLQPITAFRTSVLPGADTETRYTEPVSFGIRRCEFDHFLLQRAAVHLRCGEPLTSLRRGNDRWIVNDAITTPVLVGAGGHFCPVARHLNSAHGAAKPGLYRDAPVVAALEMEVELNARQLAHPGLDPEKPRLYFCGDFKGYGWCFRKGRFLNVGLGRQDPRELPRHTRAFLDLLVSRDVIPGDLPPRLRGHAYFLADSSPRVPIADGVLLVGDSAGLAEPHSGEGIRPAVESGILAARTILNAHGQYRRETLDPYHRSLQARFDAPTDRTTFAPTLPSQLAGLAGVAGYLGRQLMKSNWFTRHVVLERWFLGRQRPPLARPA